MFGGASSQTDIGDRSEFGKKLSRGGKVNRKSDLQTAAFAVEVKWSFTKNSICSNKRKCLEGSCNYYTSFCLAPIKGN